MHMKKMIVLATLAASLNARADYETLNAFFSVGAGFGMGGRLYTSSEFDNTTRITDKFFNYGNGMKLDIGCQYFLMENVAAQASFGYSIGMPGFEHRFQSGIYDTSTTYHWNLFGIKAMIVPRFEALDLIDVYTGVGLGFFWNSRWYTTEINILESGTLEYKGNISSSPTIGFVGMFGTDYPLNDKVTLFGEIAFEQMRFNLTKFTIKESNTVLIDATTQYYEKNQTDNLNPEKVPGSNWQIRLGIRYALITD